MAIQMVFGPTVSAHRGGNFSPFVETSTGWAGCVEGNFQCWTDNGYVPLIGKNPDNTPLFGGTHEIPPNSLMVHPAYGVISSGNDWVIMRWTAPAAGTIRYSGQIIVYDFGQEAQNPAGTLLDTVMGGTVDQIGNLSGPYGTTLAFSGTAFLAAGETFDVAVGVNTTGGNTFYAYLPTGLDETIEFSAATAAPEPSSLLLIAPGLMGVLFFRGVSKR